jgi:hypothetical protein
VDGNGFDYRLVAMQGQKILKRRERGETIAEFAEEVWAFS